MGRKVVFFSLIVLVCLAVTPTGARADTPLAVTFLSPSPLNKYPFWNDYVGFMRVAAQSLGIELTVVESETRFQVVDNAREVLSKASKPDFLMYIYQAENTREVLNLAEEAGVYSLIVNTDVMDGERQFVGYPRERYRHWIGHIFPDDFKASVQLTEILIDRARELNMKDNEGRLHMLAIGASLDTTASLYRDKGLHAVLAEHPAVILGRFVRADWNRFIAARKTNLLLEIEQVYHVIWAVNDTTAMGVVDAIQDQGLRPGVDVITGGIDWSEGGIRAVENSDMVASVGGHFMEGAWALVMMYDFAHGNDFAHPDPVLRSQMRVLDQQTLSKYLPALDRSNWDRIDFKQFTVTHNPCVTEYDFSPDAVVRELGRP